MKLFTLYSHGTLCLRRFAAALCAAALPFGAAFADPTWIGASGNWSDTANWADGVLPVETDTVRVSNTVANITINLDAPSVTIKSIRFEGHSEKGVVTVTGGKLVLTSNENTMKGTGARNTFYWEQSTAAIVAYPWGAEFQVPVEFTSSGYACVISTGSDIHFYKPVTAPNATELQFHAGTQNDPLGLAPASISTDTYLHDSLTAPKANVTTRQTPCGGLYLLGPSFEANALQSQNYVSSAVRLMSTNTVIHSGLVSPMYLSCIQSEVAGSYPTNAIFNFRYDPASIKGDDTRASIDLGFVDRTIDRLTSGVLNTTAGCPGYTIRSFAINPGGVSFVGTAPTTLTLRGTADASAECRVCDDVTVVWDPVGEFTQVLSNRTHTTKGSFIVKRGTLKLNGKGSIAAARGLEIAAGATFELDSSIADALPRDIIVTSTSKLKLNGATVNVKRLVVDGVAQADGTYTGTSWLDGEGSVVVAAGSCHSWIGGTGNWSDTANWLDGAVPSSTSDIVVLDAQSEEDITITMDADIAAANFPGALEVVNRGAGTTIVRVAASVADNNGLVRVGRHARVEVPEGGTFYYETTKDRSTLVNLSVTWRTTSVLSIVDGGVWRTCGGSTIYTNVCGQCWVNGEGSKLEVTDGMHLYSAWGSSYPLSIGSGARLEVTGGTLYQPHEGYNQETDLRLFGGTADFSGGVYKADAACVGPGSGAGHSQGSDLGYGTIIQRGTSDVRYAPTVVFRSFFIGTHLDWIVKDQAKLHERGYLIGGRRYGDATLTITDTPTGDAGGQHTCGSYYLGAIYYNWAKGADAGYGRMYIKTGARLDTGWGGVFVAGGNAAVQPNVVPFYQKGYLRVEPNAVLTAYGSTHKGYSANFHPNGINVGLAALTAITSGRLCEGLAEVSGYVTNRLSLTVGGWHGKGVYVQDGGETLTGTDNTSYEHGTTAVGYAGGEGTLLVSNGVFTSGQSVWVGGCRTNDFVVRTDGGILYPNEFVTKGGWPIDDHGAEGFIEVSGGDFATAKNLYVGSDGTGVVSVVGSTGSFRVGQDMVLSNQTMSVVRFTADEAGVKPIEIGGNLVLTPASTLDVDLSACPEIPSVKLFTLAGAMDGEFGTVNITPLKQRRLVRRGNGLYVVNQTGTLVVVK